VGREIGICLQDTEKRVLACRHGVE
jgi:hypothetical protein